MAAKIVEQLKERVEETLAGMGFRRPGEAYASSRDAIPAALAGIDTFFEDYEEVEVWVRRHDNTFFPYWRLEGPDGYYDTSLMVLRHKPPQQTVTVTRETLAVLAEHYEDTPAKDSACEAALAEAKDKL